mmetsp:Transcript_23701/g.35345  ORF Transcript_23701/g.35345 Transcript_23701/m.35345 type:complete len:106 (-) Transcript_23701:525-842(-)
MLLVLHVIFGDKASGGVEAGPSPPCHLIVGRSNGRYVSAVVERQGEGAEVTVHKGVGGSTGHDGDDSVIYGPGRVCEKFAGILLHGGYGFISGVGGLGKVVIHGG